MKKLLTVILSVLYLATSSGATLHLHYCMGTLVDVGLQSGAHTKCGRCGMGTGAKDRDKCCHHEQKQVKGEKDQRLAGAVIQPVPVAAEALQASFPELTAVYVPSPVLEHPNGNGPPRSSKLRTHIVYCVFRV